MDDFIDILLSFVVSGGFKGGGTPGGGSFQTIGRSRYMCRSFAKPGFELMWIVAASVILALEQVAKRGAECGIKLGAR